MTKNSPIFFSLGFKYSGAFNLRLKWWCGVFLFVFNMPKIETVEGLSW